MEQQDDTERERPELPDDRLEASVPMADRPEHRDRVRMALVDVILAILANMGAVLIFGVCATIFASTHVTRRALWPVVFGVVWAMSAVELGGASLGKRFAWAEIATMDGRPAPFARLLIRWLVKSLPLMFLTGMAVAAAVPALRSWEALMFKGANASACVLLFGFLCHDLLRERSIPDLLAGTCVAYKDRARPACGRAFEVTPLKGAATTSEVAVRGYGHDGKPDSESA